MKCSAYQSLIEMMAWQLYFNSLSYSSLEAISGQRQGLFMLDIDGQLIGTDGKSYPRNHTK